MYPRKLVLIAPLVVAIAACSSGGASESDSENDPTTTTTVPAATVLLQQGESAVASAGPDVALDDATRQAVLDATQRYVDEAVLAPLAQGAVGPNYAAAFDAPVSANATGADRAALTDEGIPTVTAAPTITATPVRFDSLVNRDGGVELVATSFNLDVQGQTAAGPIVVQRTAELTFAPVNGAWLISAYRIAVTRQTPDGTTSTTAATQS